MKIGSRRGGTPIRSAERGFTLIELLVVVAIIAVLAALVLAALSSAQKGSRDSKRRSDLKQYQAALVQYRGDVGSYPAANCSNKINNTPCQPYFALQPKYMSATLLKDSKSGPPPGGRDYLYYSAAPSGAFVLCAQLERTGKFIRIGPTVASEGTACGYVE